MNKMANDNITYITITLKRTTKERLKAVGRMGESYDALINRILDQVEGKGEADERK